MTNVEALKALYEEITSDETAVENSTTIVEILNEIAKWFGSNETADTNAKAIENIASVASGIVKPSGTMSITQNGEKNVAVYEKVNVEVTPPRLIPFAIVADLEDVDGSVTANALDGQTWLEWIASEYNTIGATYDSENDAVMVTIENVAYAVFEGGYKADAETGIQGFVYTGSEI